MNQKEIKTFIHDFHTAIRRLSLGLLLLILIPAPLAPLTACRPYPTPIIPLLGIGWMGLCALLAVLHLVFGILGVRTFRKAARSALTLSREGGQWLLDWKTRCAKRCIVAVILGLFLLLPWMLCLMTGSDLHRAGSPYVMVCYAGAFLFFGSAAGIVFGAVLRLLLLRRIRFVTSDGIAEEDLPAKKPHWGRFACIAGLATVLAVFLMFRGTWYIQPYIATIPAVEHRQIPITYDETTGVYTLQNPEEGDFRILQLTDIHLGGSLLSYRKDIRALQTVYDLIDRTRPDLIVVTGDFVFPLGIQSFSFNNYTPMMQFCSFMRNIGIPWALTYGNHDTEFVASHSEAELDALFRQFDHARTGTLLYADLQPEITGRSNQVLRLNNPDGSLNQLLFLIDSNAYTGKGINDYDCIHEDQVAWYADTLRAVCAAEGRTVPSMIFTHIPLQEYRTVYDLYRAGDPAAAYFYGTVGEKDEAICCPDHPSSLFRTAVELGSTQGIFCGHDHYNTISLAYQGIRLTYGMSIDYLAMPGIAHRTAQRGATLISVLPDGSMTIEPVPYTVSTSS